MYWKFQHDTPLFMAEKIHDMHICIYNIILFNAKTKRVWIKGPESNFRLSFAVCPTAYLIFTIVVTSDPVRLPLGPHSVCLTDWRTDWLTDWLGALLTFRISIIVFVAVSVVSPRVNLQKVPLFPLDDLRLSLSLSLTSRNTIAFAFDFRLFN